MRRFTYVRKIGFTVLLVLSAGCDTVTQPYVPEPLAFAGDWTAIVTPHNGNSPGARLVLTLDNAGLGTGKIGLFDQSSNGSQWWLSSWANVNATTLTNGSTVTVAYESVGCGGQSACMGHISGTFHGDSLVGTVSGAYTSTPRNAVLRRCPGAGAAMCWR